MGGLRVAPPHWLSRVKSPCLWGPGYLNNLLLRHMVDGDMEKWCGVWDEWIQNSTWPWQFHNNNVTPPLWQDCSYSCTTSVTTCYSHLFQSQRMKLRNRGYQDSLGFLLLSTASAPSDKHFSTVSITVLPPERANSNILSTGFTSMGKLFSLVILLIHLPTHPSTHPSSGNSTSLSIHPPSGTSICPSIHPPSGTFICLSICPSSGTSICLSIHPSILRVYAVNLGDDDTLTPGTSGHSPPSKISCILDVNQTLVTNNLSNRSL